MLSLPVIPVSPVIPPPFLLRRRGGQFVNHNALKHGFYALRNPTPLTMLRATVATCRHIPLTLPGMFEQVIGELRINMARTYQSLDNAETVRGRISALNRLRKLASGIVKVSGAWYAQTQPQRDLQNVARRIPAAIRYHFHRHDITRDADSFRKFLEKSDFNSPFFQESTAGPLLESSFPFIASHQWRILEPLLPPPERRSPRGRPNADPRALLDAIFWKVAHHARWQDLPAVYPPMLTCRRYYRRLFRSGRLVTLYNALYQHLVTSGNVDLLDFVNRGFFSIRQNKVILAPGNGNTWQLRTALLFLQFGIQELRQSRREIVLEQRARFPTFEALMKRKRAMQAPPPGLDEPVYTPFDFGSSRIVCSKNRDMASSNFHAGRGHAFLGLRASSEQAPLDSPGYRKDIYVPFFERTESDQQVIMKTGPFSPLGKGATTLSRCSSGGTSRCSPGGSNLLPTQCR